MKKKYSAVRTCRQYRVEDGVAEIIVTGSNGIVGDIDKVLKTHLDGWCGSIDSIKLIEEVRYHVVKCPPNESCWKYQVKDRELENITVGVFGLENQAKKYCDYLNNNCTS